MIHLKLTELKRQELRENSRHDLVDVEDSHWDENTLFIAHPRSDIPRLIGEVRRLRARLDGG